LFAEGGTSCRPLSAEAWDIDMDRTLDFWVFFAVGLLIVIGASLRQFDEPSWAPDGTSRIRGLPPSDIVDLWKFRYAFLVYILVIAALYSLLCLSARAVELLAEAVKIYLGQQPDRIQVGAVLGNEPGEPLNSGVEFVGGLPEMRTRSEFPLLVAIALGLLLRFPGVQKAERFLRRLTHALFGIPTAPERLHKQALGTRLDVSALDAAIAAVGDEARIGIRIDSYAAAAQAAIGEGFKRDRFIRSLSKILAFQYWVADRQIWPSPSAFEGSKTLAEWNQRVLEDIAALERDMALLADPSIVWLPPDADESQRTLHVSMRRERWEDLARQTERLGDEVCSLIVLCDQRSSLPDKRDPLESFIDSFLQAIHTADESRRRVLRLGIISVALCVVVNALFGWIFGDRLNAIAVRDHADEIAIGLAAPDPWTYARDWAITGLVAFGLTTWLAIAWREARVRRRRWINAFENRRGLWPVEKWVGIFAVCMITVTSIYLAYATLVGLLVTPDKLAGLAQNLFAQLRRNVEVSLAFGALAGLHGVFVAILIDSYGHLLDNRRRVFLIGLHVLAVGVAALGVAHLISTQQGSSSEVIMLRAIAQTAAAAVITVVVGVTLHKAMKATLTSEASEERDRFKPEHGATPRTEIAGPRVVPIGRAASLGLAALLFVTATPGHGQQEHGTIEVGMRGDAKPFSYVDEFGDYSGYLVSLCKRAVFLAGYRMGRPIELTASDRFNAPVDLICDPTTITVERAEKWQFSPIVFVANATFVEATNADPLEEAEVSLLADCRPTPGQRVYGAAMVNSTTATEAFAAARSLDGVLPDGPDHIICPIIVPRHANGIARLCRGEMRYYFGDTDILRAYILEQDGCRDKVLFHPTFRTYEPYAFAMPSEDPEFIRRFSRAIYAIFANREADGYFDEDPYFKGRPKSEALDMLFRLNRIPRGVPEGPPDAG
jgi:hypothetical protein